MSKIKKERESFEKQNTVLKGKIEKYDDFISSDKEASEKQLASMRQQELESQKKLDGITGKHQAYEILQKSLHETAKDLRRHSDQIIKKMTLCF